ncbi:GLPGLI family protein [Aquimarina sp. I32.4]|uniref:GLPGLI family protein n=1 Tax=Aquimarina sp. I32.4 TaxID=2053903 RepID=UPI001304C19D|nr:GLPGLI family protein [Aquimarina sp. I32.4]
MDKVLIYIFLILLTTYRTCAQKELTAIVEYNRIINNTAGTSYATLYRLYCDTQSSFYERIGEAHRVTNKKQEGAELHGEMITERVIKSGLPHDYYYTNVKSGDIIFREAIVRNLFIVQDYIESISWQLHSENKKIGKYNCQKATTKYRGRKYTAWFTSEIPISHGPWKLRGLPGLILEVTEETGKYEFHATKINLKPDIKKIQNKLKKPDTKGIVKMDTYIEALRNKAKDERAMMIASMPRGAKLLENCDECPDPKNRSLELYND